MTAAYANMRKLVEAALSDVSTGSKTNAEREKCRHDIVYFINNYVQTYDPRLAAEGLNPFVPFLLFPKQIEFIHWLEEREKCGRKGGSGLVEKSRDTGLSFMCCAFAIHRWLFRRGYCIGFGSFDEVHVDRLGDRTSLLEKIRSIIRQLPDFLKPSGFKEGVHDCHHKIINPSNGASIIGETGDNIGRGGRTSIYFVDESAYLAHPELARASLAATTDIRIDVSTPNGDGNPFAVLRHSHTVPVFTYHWRDDPRKDDEWAARKKKEIGLTAFAAEFDIDYSASKDFICIPSMWVRAAVLLKLPESQRMIAGLDIAEAGDDECVFIARRGPVVQYIEAWGKHTTFQTAYKARNLCVQWGVHELNYDADGVGAGVTGDLQSMEERERPFGIRGIHSGGATTETMWPDNLSAKEKFVNLKAELWWTLRRRFEKTFEYVTQGVPHEMDELISIPDCPELITQLSLPLYEMAESGKIRIESKKHMREKRGVASPDYADALVLSEAAYVLKKKQLWIG